MGEQRVGRPAARHLQIGLIAALLLSLARAGWALIPASQGAADGCNDLEILPHWPFVNLSPGMVGPRGGPQDPIVFEGYVRSSHVTAHDFPYQHQSHDWNFLVEPDPPFEQYVSDNSDSGHMTPDGRRSIEMEWETKYLPREFWPIATDPVPIASGPAPSVGDGVPLVGDRVWMMGRLVWDCGHSDSGYLTEIHPPQAAAFTHVEPTVFPGDRAPSVGTRTRIYVHGQGYNHDVAEDNLDAFALDYEFDIRVPPPPSPGAQLQARVLDLPFGGPTPVLTPMPDQNRVHVLYPLSAAIRQNPDAQFGAVVACGWRERTVSQGSRLLRITFDQIRINNDHDGDILFFQNSGEWQLWVSAGGEWHELLRTYDAPGYPPEEMPVIDGNVSDGQVVPLNRSWILAVPENGTLSIQTTGWESDGIDSEFGQTLLSLGITEAVRVGLHSYLDLLLSLGTHLVHLLDDNDEIGVVSSRFTATGNFGVGAHDDVSGLGSQENDVRTTGSDSKPGGSTVADYVLSYHIDQIGIYPPGSPTGLDIAPIGVHLQPSQEQRFTTNAPPGTTVNWSAVRNPASITSDGVYSAPTVLNADETDEIHATAVVNGSTLVAPPVQITLYAPLTISPPAASLMGGGIQAFTATPAIPVQWSVLGDPAMDGTIDPSGLYHAPATILEDRLITLRATTADGSGRVANRVVQLYATLRIVPATVDLWGSGVQRFFVSPHTPVAWRILNNGPGQMGDPNSPRRAQLSQDVHDYYDHLTQLTGMANLAGICGILANRADPNNPGGFPGMLPSICMDAPPFSQSDDLRRQAGQYRADNEDRIIADRAEIEAIDGTYHVPSAVTTSQFVTIEADTVDPDFSGRHATATVYLVAPGTLPPDIMVVPQPPIQIMFGGIDGTLSAADAGAPPGGIAPVPILADERVTSLAGATFAVEFDPALTLSSSDVEAGDLLPGPGLSVVANTAAPGKALVGLLSGRAGAGPGMLARLDFHIPPNAAPGTRYAVRLGSAQASDAQGRALSLGVRDGVITVVQPNSGRLLVRSVQAASDGTAAVTIDADESVKGLAGVTVLLHYDPAVTLDAADVQLGTVISGPGAQVVANTRTPGVAQISVAAAQEHDGPGTLVRLTFHVPANAASGSVYAISLASAIGTDRDGGRIVFGLTSGSIRVGAPRKGDVDGDGQVTVKDATLALEFVVGLRAPSASELAAADLNGDGHVSIGEVTRILKAAVGLTPLG